MFRSNSLSTQLSWQVSLVQVAMFAASVVAMLLILQDKRVNQVSTFTVDNVASAIDRNGPSLHLRQQDLPTEFVGGGDSAWLYACDEGGASLVRGTIPPEMEPIIALLPRLGNTEIRSTSYTLASSVVVQERSWGRLHVMVGGIQDQGIFGTVYLIFRYIGGLVLLPVILATALFMSIVIHMRLKGLSHIAAQAKSIDLTQRGRLLDTTDLPAEVAPLVSSFNQALMRIWNSSRERDRFLADAAHEIRMPIAVIATRLTSLPASPTRTQLAGDVARLENIAEQLLDLQRLRHHEEERSLLDLNLLCQQVAAEVAPLIVESGYTFSFVGADEPVIVSGDSGALTRLLGNLLQNAILHGGQRGEIGIAVSPDGRVTVSDSGPGVPSDERGNIFAPFYRLDSSVKGSGLGLHLAREIATRHGGKITATESATGGACFIVSLPVVTGHQSQQQEAS